MCAAGPSCRAPPHTTTSGSQKGDRPPGIQTSAGASAPGGPLPLPPYPCFPYPPYRAYDSYQFYQPGYFYPAPYYHVEPIPEPKGWSWTTNCLLSLLIIFVVAIVIYRYLIRDNQRQISTRLGAWLMRGRQTTKRINNVKKEGNGNYTPQLASNTTFEITRRCNRSYDDNDVASGSTMFTNKMKTFSTNGESGEEDSDVDRRVGTIIEMSPGPKISVATGISSMDAGKSIRYIENGKRICYSRIH